VRRFDSAGSYDGQAITVLRDALFENGIHVVRLVPNIVDNDAGQKVVGALTSAGFVPIEGKHRYRTFLVNVSDSEDAIRSRLRKSFRRDLRYAEKAGFEVKAGPDDELFNILVELYEGSKRRKGFKGLEMAEFRLPQGQLSREEKMKVFVAFHEGKAASALLSSELGDVSITLLAASNEAGLKGGSSYLLWYQACISSCRKGLKWCDLGGIDRQANPTVYEFKSRLGGQEVSHIGAFECYRDTRSRLVMKMVNRVI
jgi:lipid II:glycine glycyltransferase (peptidoglycan interpeptide bridge formation enzyme)